MALYRPPANLTQNTQGHWVPAIPEPMHGMFRKRCVCHWWFWGRQSYRAHYALHHIIEGYPARPAK